MLNCRLDSSCIPVDCTGVDSGKSSITFIISAKSVPAARIRSKPALSRAVTLIVSMDELAFSEALDPAIVELVWLSMKPAYCRVGWFER
jgi:hypothetical protein